MMKNWLMTLAAVLAYASAAVAQTSVHGTVLDASDRSPLPYVTVALTTEHGNILSGTTTAADGTYTISVNASPDSLKAAGLVFSFVGYIGRTVKMEDIIGTASGSSIQAGTVFLTEDAEMLAGATVAGKRPLIEHKFDKLVLNVSELAVAQTGSALDVLKSSPGVTVDKDGNVKLNGSAVSVWIDDRPSQMSGKDLEAFLKGSTGTSIEKIELISNPSSKYDAEGGGGIINIRTKKGFMKGFNGTLNASYGMAFMPVTTYDASISANLIYKTDKTNTFLQYTPGYHTFAADVFESKLYGDNDDWIQETSSLITNAGMMHNLRVGNDWNISKKDVLGVILGGRFSTERQRSPKPAVITDIRGDGYKSVLESITEADSPGSNWSVNLNYTRKFDETKAQELVLNADYNRNIANVVSRQRNIWDRTQAVGDAAANVDYGFDDVTDRVIDIYSFKADYSQVFWKQTGRLEAGAKAAVSVTDNEFGKYNYDFTSQTLGDKTERNDFTYNEQVYAAYLNVSKQFSPKWTAQAGLRGEYTVQTGNWMKGEDGAKTTHKDYFNVFPSAFVTYIPSQKAVLTLNYSYRISRPKYWQMNPYRQWINATTYNEGNPELDPFYSHNASFTAVLFSKLTLAAGYSHQKNYSYTQVPDFDMDTGMIGMRYDNAGVQQSAYFGAYLTEMPLFKWWNLTLNASYYYAWFKAYPGIDGGVFGNDFSNRGGAVSLYAATTFFLPKEFKIGIDGWMMTPMRQGYFSTGIMGRINMSVSKNLLDGRMSLSLYLNDIFDLASQNVYIMKGGVRSYSADQKYSSRGFSLGLTWRFGQSSGGSRRNVGKLDEADRL